MLSRLGSVQRIVEGLRIRSVGRLVVIARDRFFRGIRNVAINASDSPEPIILRKVTRSYGEDGIPDEISFPNARPLTQLV